jgi:hypothetical protein
MSSQFSAAPSSLGYFYQTLYALLLLLKSKEEANLSLEILDDVVFEKAGNSKEQLQLKHHTNRTANLSNESPDLWKTIRVWSTQLSNGTLLVDDTTLSLVTTGKASEGTIAAKLKPGNKDRDDKNVAELLTGIATTSGNQELKKAFAAYRALSYEQREDLIACIQILDGSSVITSLPNEIKNLLIGVRIKYRDNVYERLEGWWFDLAIRHLSTQSKSMVSKRAVEEKIAEINEQFQPDALPIDYANAVPPLAPDPTSDNRRFVYQLKRIMISNKRIEKAILDYYRAFEQRSRWVRESLLYDLELEKYEEKLVDEWERYWLALQDDPKYDDSTDEKCIEIGKNIYYWMEQVAHFQIRKQVTEDYIVRGSYHILADQQQPKVWWHPKFIEELQKLLPIT